MQVDSEVQEVVTETVSTFDKIIHTIVNVVTSKMFYVPVVTIIVAIILVKLSTKIVKKVLDKETKVIDVKRKNTIAALLQNIVKYLIWIMALLIILSAWNFDVTALITSLGVVGVVAGLALQDALKDIIAGINIIMDNYYVVGDLVTINDFTGEVIEFGLKSTKLRNVDGVILTIANREISSVKNLSIKFSSVAVVLPTPYEEKSKRVKKIIEDIVTEIDSWSETTKKTENLGVDSLSSSSVDYLIRAYCKPGDQYNLKRKMLGLIKDRFDENNLSIPYNQIEVHNDK